jgi:hypothetical protein
MLSVYSSKYVFFVLGKVIFVIKATQGPKKLFDELTHAKTTSLMFIFVFLEMGSSVRF